jgi:hypothetical protein
MAKVTEDVGLVGHETKIDRRGPCSAGKSISRDVASNEQRKCVEGEHRRTAGSHDSLQKDFLLTIKEKS